MVTTRIGIAPTTYDANFFNEGTPAAQHNSQLFSVWMMWVDWRRGAEQLRIAVGGATVMGRGEWWVSRGTGLMATLGGVEFSYQGREYHQPHYIVERDT